MYWIYFETLSPDDMELHWAQILQMKSPISILEGFCSVRDDIITILNLIMNYGYFETKMIGHATSYIQPLTLLHVLNKNFEKFKVAYYIYTLKQKWEVLTHSTLNPKFCKKKRKYVFGTSLITTLISVLRFIVHTGISVYR